MEVTALGTNEKLEQNKHEEPMSLLSRSLLTGFIGGILWGGLAAIAYYFNFVEVSPKSYVLRSWTQAGWTDTWLGNVIALLFVGVLSILIALLYYGIFKKIESMWMGVVFGIVLWAILLFILQPIFPNIKPALELNYETLITMLCLFVLYGTFIGYSISYDYHDMLRKKQQQ